MSIADEVADDMKPTDWRYSTEYTARLPECDDVRRERKQPQHRILSARTYYSSRRASRSFATYMISDVCELNESAACVCFALERLAVL